MSEMVYQRARRDATTIAEEYGDGYVPVDVDAVAASLDVEVLYTDQVPAGVSGLIVKTPRDKVATALINSLETPQRQRFTLAHELGHYVERAIARGDEDFSFRDAREMGSNDLHEFYANEFAGHLLMPASDIAACQAEGMGLDEMAVRYGVTVAALRRRLGRLETHPDVEAV